MISFVLIADFLAAFYEIIFPGLKKKQNVKRNNNSGVICLHKLDSILLIQMIWTKPIKFETRFSHIGLTLDKNRRRKNLFRILAELIWYNMLCKFRA